MSFKRANCGGIIIDDETIVEENGVLKAVSSGGTDVVANPTLDGTEADLTGLQVGDTKYKVDGSSGGGVLLVTENEKTGALDKTWQEIHDAFSAGGVVVGSFEDPSRWEACVSVGIDTKSGTYYVDFWTARFTSETVNGYPTFEYSPESNP